MKIAIAGAGALGSGFGFLLHQSGNQVTLIDNWKEHVEAINTKGLQINVNGEQSVANIQAVFPKDVNETFDVVFLFTKAMQLDGIIKEIQHTLTENTKIVCLLNGLGHKETLSTYIPTKNIFMGTTVWTAGIDEPGVVHFMGKGPVELQNIDENEKETAEEIVKLLSEAGLNGQYSENVLFSIWRKACVNGTLNVLCSILDCTIESLFHTSGCRNMMTEIINEFALAAATEDVMIDVEETVDYLEGVCRSVGPHYPSMHQDLIQNKRLTEVDYLNGAVAKMAKSKGFEAPTCQFITDLIHTKEEILGIK